MKFEEILPALREGKKIRRKFWFEGHYFKLTNDGIINQEGKYFAFGKNDLFCSDWEIFKEVKKVKLRDLTEEQYREYEKNCKERICVECPFNDVECTSNYTNCWVNHKDLYSDKFLDQEIEIKEE